MTTLDIKPGSWAVLRNGEVRGPIQEQCAYPEWKWEADDGAMWKQNGAYGIGLHEHSHDIIATLPVPPMERIRELEAENARLREALGDLMTWFPDEPSQPEWRLKAGKHGADDAISFAREALKGGEA